MRRLVLRVVLLGMVGTAVAGGRPDVALADDPIADLPFAVATDGLFSEERNDGLQGGPGRWDVLGGRLDGGALRLTVRIEPPAHGLTTESGPAVLFGGLHLFGDAGGDVATGASVDSLTAVTLAACVEAACRYLTEIALPTRDLPPAITRLEANGRLLWVSAEFTLVRTFGHGEWLQVLPFELGDAAPADAGAGHLGSIQPAGGRLFPYGLFPADQSTPIPDVPFAFDGGLDYGAVVEDRRRQAGDATEPIRTSMADLHVALRPACDGAQVLTLHDDTGDRILSERVLGAKSLDRTLALPVDSRWWLTLHDGGGIDFDQGRGGWGTKVGPIRSSGEPLKIDAVIDSAVPRGILQVEEVGGPVEDPASSLPIAALLAAAAAGIVATILTALLVLRRRA